MLAVHLDTRDPKSLANRQLSYARDSNVFKFMSYHTASSRTRVSDAHLLKHFS